MSYDIKQHWPLIKNVDACRCQSKNIYGQMGSGCVWLVCVDCDFEGPVSQMWLDYSDAITLWNKKIRDIYLAMGGRTL